MIARYQVIQLAIFALVFALLVWLLASGVGAECPLPECPIDSVGPHYPPVYLPIVYGGAP